MDLYSQQSKSLPQKITIVLLETLLLWLSYYILFQNGGNIVSSWFGNLNATEALGRRWVIFCFSLIVFIRFAFMMFFLLKRRIPWEESFSVPFAFALYYLGFAILTLSNKKALDFIDLIGILIFIIGSFINTYSELQRHFWKRKIENKGKLYTKGLFKYSMHINYFGDLLWVIGYTIVSRNIYALFIPLFLFCLFVFYNIPMLDKHLASKYESQFEEYKKKTKKFIPYLF